MYISPYGDRLYVKYRYVNTRVDHMKYVHMIHTCGKVINNVRK